MLLLDTTNYNGSDSDESLLANEGDSFASSPENVSIPEDSPFRERDGLKVSDLVKEKAKESALRSLGKPIEKKLGQLGERAGFSPEALSGLSEDTPENRERLKEEAKERAKKFSKKTGEKLEQKLAKRGVQTGEKAVANVGKGATAARDARVATTAAKGAKTAAGAAKGAKAVATGAKAAGAAAKGVQGAIAIAGVAAGPGTLGLGTIAAFLLNIAISVGLSDAIDMLFELKNRNIKQALFHAIKAIALILMFILLLIESVLMVSVAGVIFAAPLLLFLNIYAILGLFFPSVPQLQGLSRKWMLAVVILLDLYMIIIVLVMVVAILFGICTHTAIGSLLGYGGLAGDIINYIDSSSAGSGGYLSALNQICSQISTVK